MSTVIPKVITRAAVSTVWYDTLSTSITHNIPLTIDQYTTLNEKLGINQAVTLPNNSYPKVAYFAIGDKGHYITPVMNGGGTLEDAKIETLRHTSTHAALYNQKPFVLRATNNDLSSAERSKYALRKQITVGGQNYYAYYLKRLDLSAAEKVRVLYSQVNGVETSTLYTPDASSLSPVQLIPNSTQANALLGTYIRSGIKYTIEFTDVDMQEYQNACTILGEAAGISKITEIAICSGFDYNQTVTSGAASVPFVDSIGVQIAHFVPAFEMVDYSSLGFNVVMVTGMNRPLFSTEQVTAIV